MLRDGHDVTSQLVAVWDLIPQATPITILLSASAISTMEHLASGHEPLYGRISWSHQLVQFDYWDAARMMPGYDPRTAATLYGIFGGTPRYLAALDPAEDLVDGTIRTAISPRGEVHLQMQTLLEQIQGLRDIADYRSVLRVAARLIDGRLLTGEIKWSSTPLGPTLHTDLLAKLARLARSGYGWAKDTDEAIFFYASAAGYTPEMVDLAVRDHRIRLISLVDLYPATNEQRPSSP